MYIVLAAYFGRKLVLLSFTIISLITKETNLGKNQKHPSLHLLMTQGILLSGLQKDVSRPAGACSALFIQNRIKERALEIAHIKNNLPKR